MKLIFAKRIAGNILWLVLAQNTKHILNILVLAFLVRKFTLEQIGNIFSAQALLGGLFALSNYSLGFFIPSVSHKISTEINSRNFFWNLILSTRFFLGSLALVISFLFMYAFYPSYSLLWWLSIPFFLSRLIQPSLIINALETNRHLFKTGLISKTLFLISLMWIQNHYWVNFWWGLSEIIAIVIILYFHYPVLCQVSFLPPVKLFPFFKKTFCLFTIHILSALKSFSVLPLIHTFLGPYPAGIFTLADKPLEIFRQISGAAFTGFFPVFQKENIRINYRSKIFTLYILVLISLVFLLMTLAPYIIYLVNNFEFSTESTSVFRILVWGVPALFLIIPFFSEYLNNRKWGILMALVIIQVFIYIILLTLKFASTRDIALAYVVSEYVLLFLLIFLKNR